jgi:hypothetical protein
MRMVLRRVVPISAGKVIGAISAILGLLAGFFLSFFTLAGVAVQQQGGPQVPALFLGVGAIIFLPLFYGVMGFFMGMLYAAIYNVVAGYVGGLEVELV